MVGMSCKGGRSRHGRRPREITMRNMKGLSEGHMKVGRRDTQCNGAEQKNEAEGSWEREAKPKDMHAPGGTVLDVEHSLP